MRTKLFALTATIALLAVAVGPGFVAAADSGGLAVAVNQPTNEEPTVTVTDNRTGVANATVSVESLDNVTYDGNATYTTDANGTVGIPAPNTTIDVQVIATVENRTANTTATLSPVNDTDEENESAFGQEVAAFIDALLDHRNASGGIGPSVSSFILANNPGNAPDHAGPPENKTQGPAENVTQGPPADAGPTDNGTQGSPADADPDSEEEEDDEDSRNGGGPPEHAGPPENKTRGPP